MSVDILFDQRSSWVPGPVGVPYFLVEEEWGCTSGRDRDGKISRSWLPRFFGPFKEVLQRAARFPTEWAGGQSQKGIKGTNSKRAISCASYLDSVERSMRGARRTRALCVAPDDSYSEKLTRSELSEVFAKTLESRGFDRNLTRLPLNNPDSVLVAEDLSLWVERKAVALWRFLSSNQRLDCEPVTPELPELQTLAFELPLIERGCEEHVFVTHNGRTKYYDGYQASEAIETEALRVARAGGSPALVYRAFDRSLRKAPSANFAVEFELTEADVKRWRPLIDLRVKPGLHRVQVQDLKPYGYAEALQKSQFNIIRNEPALGLLF